MNSTLYWSWLRWRAIRGNANGGGRHVRFSFTTGIPGQISKLSSFFVSTVVGSTCSEANYSRAHRLGPVMDERLSRFPPNLWVSSYQPIGLSRDVRWRSMSFMGFSPPPLAPPVSGSSWPLGARHPGAAPPSLLRCCSSSQILLGLVLRCTVLNCDGGMCKAI